MQGHKEGELWGLAAHPSKALYATVSDDRSVRIWSYEGNHQLISFKVLKQPGRCVGFSPDGKALAVGLKDGEGWIIEATALKFAFWLCEENDLTAFHLSISHCQLAWHVWSIKSHVIIQFSVALHLQKP